MGKDLIEQLWAQALHLGGDGMTQREAFAALVAEECAKVADAKESTGFPRFGGTIAHAIRERFKP